jgi:glutamate synthase domain-containing protein 3
LVDLVSVDEEEDIELLKKLIQEHHQFTDSSVAKKILDEWEETLPQFVKVFPRDYRRVLEERKLKKLEEVA